MRGVQRGGGTPLLENITFPQVILAYIKAFDSKLRTFKLKKTDYLIIDLCHKENDYYVLLNDSLLTRRNEQRVDVELMDNRDLLREDHNSIHCPGNDSNAKKQMFKGKSQQKIINMTGCLPEQDKFIDKEDPIFICPVELENGFYEKKNKTENCFINNKIKIKK